MEEEKEETDINQTITKHKNIIRNYHHGYGKKIKRVKKVSKQANGGPYQIPMRQQSGRWVAASSVDRSQWGVKTIPRRGNSMCKGSLE